MLFLLIDNHFYPSRSVIILGYGRLVTEIELARGYYSTDDIDVLVRIVIIYALHWLCFYYWVGDAGSLEMDIQRGA